MRVCVFFLFFFRLGRCSTLRGYVSPQKEDDVQVWYVPDWAYSSTCMLFSRGSDFFTTSVFTAPYKLVENGNDDFHCSCTGSDDFGVPLAVRVYPGADTSYVFPELRFERRTCQFYNARQKRACSVFHSSPISRHESSADVNVFDLGGLYEINEDMELILKPKSSHRLRYEGCETTSVLQTTGSCSKNYDSVLFRCDGDTYVLVFGERVVLNPFDVERNGVPLTKGGEDVYVSAQINSSLAPTVLSSQFHLDLSEDGFERVNEGLYFPEKKLLLKNRTAMEDVVKRQFVSVKKRSVRTLFLESEKHQERAVELFSELRRSTKDLLVGLFDELTFNLEKLSFDSFLVSQQQFWDLNVFHDLRFLKMDSLFTRIFVQLDNGEAKLRNIYLSLMAILSENEITKVVYEGRDVSPPYLLKSELKNEVVNGSCFAAPTYFYSDGYVKTPEEIECSKVDGLVVSNSTHSFVIEADSVSESSFFAFQVFSNYEPFSGNLDDRLAGDNYLQSRAAGQGPVVVFEIENLLDRMLRKGQVSLYKPHVKWVSGWDKLEEGVKKAVEFVKDVGEGLVNFFNPKTWVTVLLTLIPLLVGVGVTVVMLRKAYKSNGLIPFLRIAVFADFVTVLFIVILLILGLLRNFLNVTEKCKKIDELALHV